MATVEGAVEVFDAVLLRVVAVIVVVGAIVVGVERVTAVVVAGVGVLSMRIDAVVSATVVETITSGPVVASSEQDDAIDTRATSVSTLRRRGTAGR
jgi:hypothetical protein